MLKRILTDRWVRAGLVAVAVAAWPACALDVDHEPGDLEFAPLDFTLKDMHGNDVDLADFRGRPLIVNFWATWCAPCKHEIPAFIDLVEKYRDQGLTILGVSVDDPPEDLLLFAEEYGINYPILVGLGREDIAEAYGAHIVVPVSWFIRPDGTVYLKKMGTQTAEWFEEQVLAILE
jgi:cytochrome c biogenesis protein CcmG/thiol:disulfide interchange protein DsbE